MRFTLTVALFLFVLIFPNELVYSQSKQDLCVVDIQMIFQQSDAGRDAKSRLELKQRDMEKALGEMKEEIEKAKTDLERESVVINEKARSEKERELRIKVNDFNSSGMQFQQELDDFQKNLVSEIEESIIDIISELGKLEKYLVVLNKSAVLYSENTLDISDRVLKRYNIEYAKNK